MAVVQVSLGKRLMVRCLSDGLYYLAVVVEVNNCGVVVKYPG